MDVANSIEHELLSMFIFKDFIATHAWLPLNPKRQAIEEYQSNPVVQQRINDIVGNILEIIEKYGDA